MPVVSYSDAQLAAMALEDARKTLLEGGVSGRVRLDAVGILRGLGMSLRQASSSVDYVLMHGADGL